MRLLSLLLLLMCAELAGCRSENCVLDGCPSEQLCNRDTKRCEQALALGCVEEGCAQGEVCDRTTGRCLAPTDCRAPQDGCEGEGCAPCSEGQICDTRTGFCVSEGVCQYLTCPQAQRCEPSTGACEAVYCADDAACPEGSVCGEAGVCLPGCRQDEDCREGELCLSDGAGGGSCSTRCTRDEECPWGEACLQDEGRSRCVEEGPCASLGDCRPGEECRQSRCQRALCERDGECLVGELCLEDTGECVSAQCADDPFEDNDAPGEAWRLRRGLYSGLALCFGEEDWFALETRGARTLRVSLLHAAEADLDLEVYFGGRLVGRSAQAGYTERVEVPAGLAGDLAIRVYSARGLRTIYRLDADFAETVCAEDLFEPNDALSEATGLQSGVELALTTCAQDEDWVALTVRPGPVTLRASAQPVAPERWSVLLQTPTQPAQPLPTGDDPNARVLSLAYVGEERGLSVLSRSPGPVHWTLEAQPEPQPCDDPDAANHTPEEALPLPLTLGGEATERDGRRLCAATQDPGMERDWYALQAPDEALSLRVWLQSPDAPTWGAVPPLRATLYAGPQRAPWRAVVLEQGQGPALLAAQLSRAERPLWLRLDAAEGLPALLERWPSYGLRVEASALAGCLQDATEGAQGNDDLARATPAQGAWVGVLCPNDVDALRFEDNEGVLWLTALESPITLKVSRGPEEEPSLIYTLDPAQGPVALNTLEGWPADAPQVWVALLAGAVPERGALYRVEVQP